MNHPVQKAAAEAGLLGCQPATAHPFDLWRVKRRSLPLGLWSSLEHEPAMLCGWPLEEMTLWSAFYRVPPFADWPEGCGEISHYYFLEEANTREKSAAWADSVRKMGHEVIVNPPLPHRAVAIRAGLGVPGLSGLLVTPEYGTFVRLVMLLVRMRPPGGTRGPKCDESKKCNLCGRCQKACPAGAIGPEGLDVTRCLRTLMWKPEMMSELYFPLMGQRILGCETCQRVCPENRFVFCSQQTPEQMEAFQLNRLLADPDWISIKKWIPNKYLNTDHFRIQAVIAAANSGNIALIPLIRNMRKDADVLLNKAIDWALFILENPPQ